MIIYLKDFEESLMGALAAEFIRESESGTLDVSNYTEESMELVQHISYILSLYTKQSRN